MSVYQHKPDPVCFISQEVTVCETKTAKSHTENRTKHAQKLTNVCEKLRWSTRGC